MRCLFPSSIYNYTHLRHHFYWCHRFYACLTWMMEKRNRDRGGEDIRTFSHAFLGLTYLIRFGHIHSRRFPPFPQGRHRRWQRESCPYVPIWLVPFLLLSPRRSYYRRLSLPYSLYYLLCSFSPQFYCLTQQKLKFEKSGTSSNEQRNAVKTAWRRNTSMYLHYSGFVQ